MEMYVEVLEAIYQGFSKPTQIMYNSGLSYNSLNDMLPKMIELGLITVIENDTGDKRTKYHYYITHKGVNVVRYLNKARDLLAIENSH